jgi:hypothetical protein
MVFNLRTRRLEKSIREISRFNVSNDFGGVLKMHFGELKMRFFPFAPIYIVWYVRKLFDSLEVSKCILIWILIYIRDPIICYKSYQNQNFYQLTRLYSVIYRFYVWHIIMVLILRTQSVQKRILEISRLNLPTDFGGVKKIHFCELKMRFC